MGDEDLGEDAEGISDRLRAAYATLPSLLATWTNGRFDSQKLSEWLVRVGEVEIDSPTDGEGPPAQPP